MSRFFFDLDFCRCIAGAAPRTGAAAAAEARTRPDDATCSTSCPSLNPFLFPPPPRRIILTCSSSRDRGGSHSLPLPPPPPAAMPMDYQAMQQAILAQQQQLQQQLLQQALLQQQQAQAAVSPAAAFAATKKQRELYIGNLQMSDRRGGLPCRWQGGGNSSARKGHDRAPKADEEGGVSRGAELVVVCPASSTRGRHARNALHSPPTPAPH